MILKSCNYETMIINNFATDLAKLGIQLADSVYRIGAIASGDMGNFTKNKCTNTVIFNNN